VGCHRDLHEHLGKGFVGLKGFEAIFSTPQFAHCALILETPKAPAPNADLQNLKTLRSLLPS
jgi:deoxyribonuclease-4